MKRILKNKFFGFAILAALVITLVMTIAQIPSAKSTIQNVPVGIVNQDQGPVGKKMVNKVMTNKNKAAHADHPMFKWHEYKNIKEANKSLSFDGNYAVVVIPKNLSKNIMQTAQTGKKINIDITINQGRNHTLATTIQPILVNIFQKAGNGIGTSILGKMGAMNLPIPAKNAESTANPITTTVKTVHKTTNLEAANSVFFQPIWIASLVTTLLLYFASKAFNPKSKKDVLAFKTTVIGITLGISCLIGFSANFYANQILNYHFNNSFEISIFLTIASFAFIMLFSGFISWLGLAGLVIFGILLFFGIPLLVVAPQMLPQFYQDWILPWLPMRFLYEGLRDMLFFNAGFFNHATWALIIIAFIGLTMFFLETFNKRHKATFID